MTARPGWPCSPTTPWWRTRSARPCSTLREPAIGAPRRSPRSTTPSSQPTSRSGSTSASRSSVVTRRPMSASSGSRSRTGRAWRWTASTPTVDHRTAGSRPSGPTGSRAPSVRSPRNGAPRSAPRAPPGGRSGTRPAADGDRRLPAGHGHHHLDVADMPLEEGALAVAEVEVPQALETGVEAESGDLRPVALDVLVPPAQGLRVVTSDVLEVHQGQGRSPPGTCDGLDRGEAPTREDQLAHEVGTVLRPLVAAVVDGDRLQCHQPVGAQQSGTGADPGGRLDPHLRRRPPAQRTAVAGEPRARPPLPADRGPGSRGPAAGAVHGGRPRGGPPPRGGGRGPR